MKITRCKKCNKPLALNETAWASRDGMFCTKTCGLQHAFSLYTEEDGDFDTRVDKAVSYFEDVAEEISRDEFGAKLERWSIYSPEADITTVLESAYEGDYVVQTSVVGFYFGEPNKEYTAEATLTATFVD